MLPNKTIAHALIAFSIWSAAVAKPQAALAAEKAAAGQLDERKLDVAKHLTDWMQSQLVANKAIAAVVSRKGGKDLKSRDTTGMAHSGLAIYDPRAQTWILYQILNVPHNGEPIAELWRSAPVDFFYGQTGYEENALIMIPDQETQKRIYDAIVTGDAWKMAFTHNYNLLSTYDSAESLNCNKWILMTIAAARTQDFNPYNTLTTIRHGFEPAQIRLNFVERQVVKHKTNVRRQELPGYSSAIETVTPESLYYSGLFPKKIFASQPRMNHVPI
jgi:hypothetical protein